MAVKQDYMLRFFSDSASLSPLLGKNKVSRVAPTDCIYPVTKNVKHGTAFKTVKDSKTGIRYYSHTVMASDLGITKEECNDIGLTCRSSRVFWIYI